MREYRSAVYVLMEILSSIENGMNLPTEIKPYLHDLSDHCRSFLGNGFTYFSYYDDYDELNYQIIDIL